MSAGDPQPHGHHSRGERIAQLAFLAVLLAYLVVLTVQLPGLSHGARFFPSIILAISFVFVGLKIASTLSARAARFLEPDVSWFASMMSRPAGAAPEAPAEEGAPAPAPARSPFVPWLWLAGAVISMYALGFLAGTALSVLVYMRFIDRDTWRASVLVAGVTVLFAWLVFVRAMHIPLEVGLFGRLF